MTAGNVVFGDMPTGALTRVPGDGPGAYPITQGTFTYGSNYALAFVSGTLTIQPQPTTTPSPSVPLSPGIRVVGVTPPGAADHKPLLDPLPAAPLEILSAVLPQDSCAIRPEGTLACE